MPGSSLLIKSSKYLEVTGHQLQAGCSVEFPALLLLAQHSNTDPLSCGTLHTGPHLASGR